MKNLIKYGVFENNIKREEYPNDGINLTKREILIIEQSLGKSIVRKLFRRISVTKDDGYYYVKIKQVNQVIYFYVPNTDYHMVYSSFKELLEYLTFKKHIYLGNVKKVMGLIGKNTIDLTFDGGYLLHWASSNAFPMFIDDNSVVKSFEYLCKYKFENPVRRGSIEKLMNLSERYFYDVSKVLNLIEYILEGADDLSESISDLLRISIEKKLNFNIIEAFVYSKHFSPEAIRPIHKLLELCVWKEDLKSFKLLIDNGLIFEIEWVKKLIKERKDNIKTDKKILDEMDKILEKY